MLNTDHYRSSTENREILRIIQKSTTLPGNILWQSHALDRVIIPVQHLEIDYVSREVVVTFDCLRFEVDFNLPLYVKLDYRSSVFKVEEFRKEGNTLHFVLPTMLKTLELRTAPRKTFTPKDERTVSLKASVSHKDSGNELHARVCDFSKSGLGVIVTEQNRAFLKNNRILWVTALQGHPLDIPILAEVVYLNAEVDPKFLVKKQKDLKVGLKLSSIIPEDRVIRFLS